LLKSDRLVKEITAADEAEAKAVTAATAEPTSIRDVIGGTSGEREKRENATTPVGRGCLSFQPRGSLGPMRR
jgi:hypothetical protein